MHAVSTDVAHKMHSARHVCGHCVYTHTHIFLVSPTYYSVYAQTLYALYGHSVCIECTHLCQCPQHRITQECVLNDFCGEHWAGSSVHRKALA